MLTVEEGEGLRRQALTAGEAAGRTEARLPRVQGCPLVDKTN